MNIISTLKSINLVESLGIKELLVNQSGPTLLTSIEKARKEWQHAVKEMNHIDIDMAEYIIFKINAAERRFMALLEQAKKEGITAWPDMTGACFPENNYSDNGSAEKTSICGQ